MNFVGRSVPRMDARTKVTGQTKYAGDLSPGSLHRGRILFSAHPRARVLRIDTSQAEQIPGVRAVITAPDLPGRNRYGYNDVLHRPILVAEGEDVRFIGDALALAVADCEAAARQATAAIIVHYEPLPPVTSPSAAMRLDAPRIHAAAEGNICCRREFTHGDAAAAIRSSDVVVEQTYVTPRQEHAFLETEAGVALVDETGVLQVLSCLQDPYGVAENIHQALGIPKSRIRVKATPVGGGFGGKLDTTLQVHLAAMAWLTGVPVRLVLDREESFIFHAKRHPMEIRLRCGASRDGRVLVMDGDVIADAGPYSGRSFEVVGLTISALIGPYRIGNVAITGRGVHTDNLDSGAFRGFGAPQAALARELLFDKLARALGISPLELRRKNLLRPGDLPVSPMLGDSPNSLAEIDVKLHAKLGDKPRPSAAWKRVGRAVSFDMPVFDIGAIPMLGKSGVGAAIEIHSDGSISVHAGGVEIGQGISTVLAQITADEFAIPIEDIRVEMSDTWTCPRAGRTSASRLTYVLGNAVLLTTAKLKTTLIARASEALQEAPERLVFVNGAIRVVDAPDRRIKFTDLARTCSDRGDNLREQGWHRYPGDRYIYGHTFMGAAADVEVDVETGEVRLLKLVNLLDVGKVINPVLTAGQQYGAVVQALGYGLMENMTMHDGRLQTPTLAEYLIPTALDLPDELAVDYIETSYPTGPHGAKGIGEAALNCTAPTILNAIADAIGAEVRTMPLLPEHILEAISETKV